MESPRSLKHKRKAQQRRVRTFRAQLLRWFAQHERDFPWRRTRDPYRILVSEIMLQQTQTDRVLPFYQRFLKQFPSLKKLAGAPTRELLSVWQGLGYNRRALALRELAREVVARFAGKIPSSPILLAELPGIGPYTAGAVAAFAFGESSLFIETNIRTVFLHEFFPQRTGVSDSDIMPLLAAFISRGDPRINYFALMDYGAALKKTHGNSSRRSLHYRKQTPFKGSLRELRGKILKMLAGGTSFSRAGLYRSVSGNREQVMKALSALVREGFVRDGARIRLRD
jgi:A/G-specific adenine glycosylase